MLVSTTIYFILLHRALSLMSLFFQLKQSKLNGSHGIKRKQIYARKADLSGKFRTQRISEASIFEFQFRWIS